MPCPICKNENSVLDFAEGHFLFQSFTSKSGANGLSLLSVAASVSAMASVSHPTVSIAIPGSVIDNAQSADMAAVTAGQIARAAAIYRVVEIVILDDSAYKEQGKVGQGAAFLAKILQYLETPQYLRKALVPLHSSLRHAGILPPLDTPHHMRNVEWSLFREAVVLRSQSGLGSFLDVGLSKEAHVDQPLKPGLRVTLRMGCSPANVEVGAEGGKTSVFSASLATPMEAMQSGLYWGYFVRIATDLNDMTTNCPFTGGYDKVVGTSEHATYIPPSKLALTYKHLLLVFGGPAGLEKCFSCDQSVAGTEPKDAFDMYLNTCPEQGSRTIRTEEAIVISLAYLGQQTA